MYRCREVTLCPESINRPNTKEIRMKLKTKIKAGKLATNHNTTVH
jgi:hypothetical protein